MKQDYPLNAQQELFVAEYLVDLHARKAAERAGYSGDSCSGLMNNDKIREAIDIGLYKRTVKSEIKADTVLIELYRIATSDVTDIFEQDVKGGLSLKELKQLPEELKRCIKSIEHHPILNGEGYFTGYYKTKVLFYDKVKALELLGKHLNIFAENVVVSSPQANPLLEAFKTGLTKVWEDKF